MSNPKPLFIIGNPRSGTSFLRMMLTSHPDIAIPPESHFFLWLEEKYSNWNEEFDIDQFLDDLYASTKFETWNIPRIILKGRIIELRPRDYSELIREIYIEYGRLNGKRELRYWGDKNKLWKEKLNRVVEIFPDVKFIHIVRDGRDVACSFKDIAKSNFNSKYAPSLPSEIISIAERWKQNISFIENFEKHILPQNFYTISYEALIQRTEKCLSGICDFLEISFSDHMLYYKFSNSSAVFEPSEFMEWKQKLINPPDVKNIGKYKSQLTELELKEFESIARKQLLKYNYHIDE